MVMSISSWTMSLSVVCTLICLGLSTVQSRSSGVPVEDFDNLRGLVDDMRQEILQLKAELKAEHINTKEKLDHLTAENEIIKRTPDRSSDKLEIGKEQYSGVVAFLARINGFTGSAGSSTVIPFDIVDLNIGNGYNPATGEFSPPVSGIYEISYEATGSCEEGHICVQLHVNTVGISESCDQTYESCGTSVTLQLSAGDTVTLSTDGGASCRVLSGLTAHNKFSGHLVYQII